jgi:hypothetical protein
VIPKVWPIIVGGCHRSGTSLLRRILNAHSRIYCGPEVKFFRDFYGDYEKDPIRHGRFLSSARSMISERELLEIMGQGFVTLHERAAVRAGKPRWADKNPENVVFLKEWGWLLGEDWVFVHVVRNPLDTLASIKEAVFPFAIPGGLDDRIAFYQRYTRAGLDFGEAHPDRYVRLKYEDLVVSPRIVLGDLMERLGEHFEAGQIEFHKFPHQQGLEDPKVGKTAEIHVQSVGRWPTRLSPEEAQTIWSQTRCLWTRIEPNAQANVINAGSP